MRDRTGEPVEERAHHCRDGWIRPPDGDDPPKPCLTCRPWLVDRRPPTRAELQAFEARRAS